MRGNIPSLGSWRPRWHPTALMVVPALALLTVFVYWPTVRTAFLSVHATDLFGEPTRFVGLSNFVSFVTDPASRMTLVTTCVFAALTEVFTLVPALALTLFLTPRGRGGRFVRLVYSLPFAYSASSASVLFAALYNPATGILNLLLHQFGLSPVNWLGSPGWALVSVAVATSWWQLGFAVLVLTGAVRSLPGDVLEAAQLDGAGFWRTRLSIVLPLISPSVFFLLVTGAINGVQTFTQIALLTRGGPARATTTLVYDLYLRAFGYGQADYGHASVLAVVLLVLVVVMTAVQFGLFERRVHY